jgi:hypothetical protein
MVSGEFQIRMADVARSSLSESTPDSILNIVEIADGKLPISRVCPKHRSQKFNGSE